MPFAPGSPMSFLTEDQWVERFADRLLTLCEPVAVQRDQLVALGRRLHLTCFYLVPEEVAGAEFECWPHGLIPALDVTAANPALGTDRAVRRRPLPAALAWLTERR